MVGNKKMKKVQNEIIDKHDVQKIGEYLASAELHKRGYKVGIVSGGVKDFDLLITSSKGDSTPVEIKTKQTSKKMSLKTCGTKPPDRSIFPIIFVLIHIDENKDHKARFFIIPPNEIKKRQQTVKDTYGKIHPQWKGKSWLEPEDIVDFEDRWDMLQKSINMRER